MYLFKLVFLFFLDIYPGMELLGHLAQFIFLRNVPTIFHSDCINLHSHQLCTKIPFLPLPWYHFIFVFFLMIAILIGMRWHFIVILICISLMGLWCWEPFHVPVSHLYIYFGKVSIQFYCPFLKCFFFPDTVFLSYLYMLDINPRSVICNIFSHSVGSFHFSSFFCCARALRFN